MKHTLLAAITNPVLDPIIGGDASTLTADQTAGTVGLAALVSAIMSLLLIISFIFLFLYLVLGGITWVTSEGDKAKLEMARNKIVHAIIGIIVVGATYAIALLVAGFLGLDLNDLPFPTLSG